MGKAVLGLAIFVLACGDPSVTAQQPVFSGQPTPEQIKKMQEMRSRARSQRGQNKPPTPKPTDGKKPEKKDEKKAEEKKKGRGNQDDQTSHRWHRKARSRSSPNGS